jgi:outer membrane protein assembly factor BamB
VERVRTVALLAAVTIAFSLDASGGEWPTSRGDFARTGNPGGKDGPGVPRVLWVYKAKEHFIGSPTPGDGAVFAPALGAYNTGLFRCLSLRTEAPDRVLWSKSSPFIKRPTVCSPALSGGLVIFGDGMHQTDDAWLYALKADSGRLVWQLSLPGKLVHIEAPPTVDRGSVFVCGGAAGVLCVAADRVTLGNEEMDLAQAQERLDKAWAEVKAKYEAERAKHPDFAVPPDEDAIQKPSPRIRWQKGKGEWHVDAPVALSGSRLFVASCFLDEESTGKRALLCLKAESGETSWETPLQINPWAGPTVTGNMVLVAGSTIRFDPALVKQAEGDVVAVDRSSGQIKWRNAFRGGVLSPVCVGGDTVLFTATDGRLRALDLATGAPKWSYDAGKPFFGGPAIAGQSVYAVDLNGVLHAVNLRDGTRIWQINIPATAEVFAPGMVYGSPAVSEGRIYLGTCNVHAGGSDDTGAIVCIADETVKAREAAAVRIEVDVKRRTVAIPCRIAPRKLPFLAEIYPLEVVASLPAPSGQKAHETVVTFEARPSEIRNALLKIGLREGKPVKGDTSEAPSGDPVSLFVDLPLSAESVQTVPVESLIVETRTGKTLPKLKWHFTGSAMLQPDPEKNTKVLGADSSGAIITLFPVTDETLIQSSMPMADRRSLRLETNKDVLPPEGTDVRLLIVAADSTGSGLSVAPEGLAQPLSWLPPPSETATPKQGRADILVDIEDRTNGLPPVVGFTTPRPLAIPPRPAWHGNQKPDGVPFTGTPAVTAQPTPPLSGGPRVRPKGIDADSPVALPPPLAPSQHEPPSSHAGAVVSAGSAALATGPALRQSAAPRVLLQIPDPFETERAVRMNVNLPDTEHPVRPPHPPAQTNLPVVTPVRQKAK